MNPKVDIYFMDGCGRCPLGGTPACKVHNWQKEMAYLRTIILDCLLTEELKWGVPVYTFQKHNIMVLAAFKDYCSVSFFKGALLHDAEGILSKPGENTQAARLIKFTNIREIVELESVLKAYIYEAIEVEKANLKIEFKKNSEPIPDELQKKFDEYPDFKTAFFALTAGRQRGYVLHFSQPKQTQTRTTRIEKCMPRIFEGRGLND